MLRGIILWRSSDSDMRACVYFSSFILLGFWWRVLLALALALASVSVLNGICISFFLFLSCACLKLLFFSCYLSFGSMIPPKVKQFPLVDWQIPDTIFSLYSYVLYFLIFLLFLSRTLTLRVCGFSFIMPLCGAWRHLAHNIFCSIDMCIYMGISLFVLVLFRVIPPPPWHSSNVTLAFGDVSDVIIHRYLPLASPLGSALLCIRLVCLFFLLPRQRRCDSTDGEGACLYLMLGQEIKSA